MPWVRRFHPQAAPTLSSRWAIRVALRRQINASSSLCRMASAPLAGPVRRMLEADVPWPAAAARWTFPCKAWRRIRPWNLPFTRSPTRRRRHSSKLPPGRVKAPRTIAIPESRHRAGHSCACRPGRVFHWMCAHRRPLWCPDSRFNIRSRRAPFRPLRPPAEPLCAAPCPAA